MSTQVQARKDESVRFVVIPYRMDLPYSVEQAYAWLTDYSDEDPGLTDAIVKNRPVLERSKDRVVLDGEIEVMGRRSKGRAVVHLHPPDRWVATFPEKRTPMEFEYRLEPRPGGGSRLLVEYRMGVRSRKAWLTVTLGKPFAKREIHRMWQGFARNMARDLG